MGSENLPDDKGVIECSGDTFEQCVTRCRHGHARNDRGVPAYLAAKAVGETVISLVFMEVGEGKTEPTAYARRFGSNTLPFDYVWFTPRLENVDPCEKFRAELERLRKAK